MIMRDPNPYKLLTPGPLTTTLPVREAMMIDRCTWDDDYKRMTEEIRAGLLDFAHAGDDYTVVLMQGLGHLRRRVRPLERSGRKGLRPCSRERRLFRTHGEDSRPSRHRARPP